MDNSAATLALLFAEHAPRLAGGLAYAPATDDYDPMIGQGIPAGIRWIKERQ